MENMQKLLSAAVSVLFFSFGAQAQDWHQIQQLYQSGMYSQAVRLLEDNASPQAQAYRALCSLQLRLDNARAQASAFLQRCPDNLMAPQVRWQLALDYFDSGQYEAAYALGYSNRRTFFRIILPQAVPHILPSYRGEVIGLIKATAVVGYIAVQDLTKMGDIVRSRTYEAFFPLIAVTVIYFVLEALLGFLIRRITISINPKKRKREKILKGIRMNVQKDLVKRGVTC